MVERSRAGRRRWSIATRLTAFYIVSVCLLLFAFMVGFHFALQAQEEREDHVLLSTHVAHVRAILLEEGSRAAVQFIKAVSAVDVGPYPIVSIRVSDAAGRVVAETPSAQRFWTHNPAGVPDENRPVFYAGHTDQGEFFRSMTARITGERSEQRWLVQLAIDESADVRFGNSLRRNITVLLILGLITTAILGVWMARSAVRPLITLTTATHEVTANRLRAQLDTAGWPVELARLANGFERMLARLEESFDRLTQFSANLSHELRTPIHNLRGEAEVALAQASTPEEFRAVLESSLEEYTRFTRLIDSLLFIARAESSEIKLEGEELDVPREAAAVIEFHEAQADERGVKMMQNGGGRLRSDSVLFRRMLSNLFSNAIRHTPPGGRVELVTERHTDGRLEVRVSDTGSGIPAEHLARVYDRFYRVEPPRSDVNGSGGFGLGLAIVKSIMVLHEGTISVESQMGAGTSVRLVFPAERVA